jgi:hypothetical protein
MLQRLTLHRSTCVHKPVGERGRPVRCQLRCLERNHKVNELRAAGDNIFVIEMMGDLHMRGGTEFRASEKLYLDMIRLRVKGS